MKKIPITVLISIHIFQLFAQTPIANSTAKGVEIWNCHSINTERTEFAPAFYQYGLVYASSGKSGKIDPQSGEPFFELYFADTDRNFYPLQPRPYSWETNSQYHEGGVTFSKKWDVMYFSSSNQDRGLSVADGKGISRMKIYERKRGEIDWEKAVELPFNNDRFSCFHPTLTADGQTLYFASDMPGGKGGFDLYKVERKTKGWSKPINLGSSINTSADEAFPFIHESGTLFFASRGHQSMGGFDVFKTDLKGSAPAVSNLGLPFNSISDDLGLILHADGSIGYFCSNREGGLGKDDIYLFKSEFKLSTDLADLKVLMKVRDAVSLQQIGGAEIRIFEKSDGRFLSGEEFYDVKLTTNPNGKDLSIETVRKAVEKLGNPSCYSTSSGDVQYELKNKREYLILVNKAGYQTKELNYINTESSEVVTLEILLEKTQKPSLKGLLLCGKSKTAIPGANISIVNQANQKTESIQTNSEGAFEFSTDPNNTYTIKFEKAGYSPLTESLMIAGDEEMAIQKRFVMIPLDDQAINKPIETGTVIVLEKIYYDFDKAIIRMGAAVELDALAGLMKKYNSMEIELISHTDSRGSVNYNQRLSDSRAIAAKQYLVAKGISAGRIAARGAGESRPRNSCSDGIRCSEEDHQYNRRTEVVVTKISEPAVKVEYGSRGPEVINGRGK